jgi:hypothetical protein
MYPSQLSRSLNGVSCRACCAHLRITAHSGVHTSIILAHHGHFRATYLRPNGSGQTQVSVAAPASLEIPMIVSSAVVHCPNEGTSAVAPARPNANKAIPSGSCGPQSTMYAGTGSRARNVSAAKSNPLHLSPSEHWKRTSLVANL